MTKHKKRNYWVLVFSICSITMWGLGCTFKPLNQKFPWSISPTHYAGEAMDMGNVDLAIRTLTPYVDLESNSNYRLANKTLGLAYYQNLDYASAIIHFQKAENITISDLGSAIPYVIASVKIGNYRKAISVLRQIFQQHQSISNLKRQNNQSRSVLFKKLRQIYASIIRSYYQQQVVRLENHQIDQPISANINWQNRVAILPIIELELKPPRFPIKVFRYLLAELLDNEPVEVVPIAVLDQILEVENSAEKWNFDIQTSVKLARQFGFSTVIVTEVRSSFASLPAADEEFLLSFTILNLQKGQVYESPILTGSGSEIGERLVKIRSEILRVVGIHEQTQPVSDVLSINFEKPFYTAWSNYYLDFKMNPIQLSPPISLSLIQQRVMEAPYPMALLPLSVAQEVSFVEETKIEELQNFLDYYDNKQVVTNLLEVQMRSILNQRLVAPYVRGNGHQRFSGTDVPISLTVR